MLYYIIPFILTLLFSFIYDFRKDQKGNNGYLLWILLFIYWTLLIGLRYEVGGDTYNYMGMYALQPTLEELDLKEMTIQQPFFAILFSFSKSLSNDFWCFSLIHILIVNVFLYNYIVKHVHYKFLSLFLIDIICYLYFTTEIVREVLSILVFIYSIKYFNNRNWIKYYLCVTIALMFHLSSLFLFCLPFFRDFKLHSSKFFLAILILPILILSISPIFNTLGSISIFTDKVKLYENNMFSGYLFSFLYIMRFTLFPLLIVIIHHRYKLPCRNESLICVLALVGICTVFRPVVFARFANYLYIPLSISIADLVGHLISSKKRIRFNNAMAILLLCCLVYGSYYIHMRAYTLWCPYYSIFNPQSVVRYYFNLYH